MRLRLALGCLLLGTLIAAAQNTITVSAGKRPVSLQECIDLALSRNLNLEIQRVRAEGARFDLRAAYGVYDPLLSFEARNDYVNRPSDFDAAKFNPYFPYSLETQSAEAKLSGNLPTGLSYDFDGRSGGKWSRTDFSSDPDFGAPYPFGIRNTNDYFAEASVTVRQHLLKDAWIDADRLAIKLRRKDLRISQEALRLEVMKTVLAVETEYYDLAAARERIRVEEQALELKQQFVAETKRRVEVGDLPPLDSEQAESQLQNTLTALAATRETEGALQNALKSLLTDDFAAWVDVELDPTEPLMAVVQAAANRSTRFQAALRNRPDIAVARLAVEKSEAGVQFRMNQLFPSLDLVGQYGGVGVQADSTDAMSDALHFRNPEYFYGVVVSFPLGNFAARNNLQSGKAAREIAELELKKAEQAVLVQIADWMNRADSRYQQVASTRKARTYAEAALAAEQKKLQNGLSTGFVVLELQEELTLARTAEIDAKVAYNKALAQLAFAEGQTLEREKLSVEHR